MRLKEKAKRIFTTIFILSTSLIYFLVIHIGYSKQNIDLSREVQYTGEVVDCGIGYAKDDKKSEVFYLSIRGLRETLGIYRMTKNYDDLLGKVQKGDLVKVYYRPQRGKVDEINIDLIQLDKNGQVIIPKIEYENKESSLIYIGLIGVCITFYIAYRHYTKDKRQKRKQ